MRKIRKSGGLPGCGRGGRRWRPRPPRPPRPPAEDQPTAGGVRAAFGQMAVD
jgi:hypothetical protein